MRISRMSYMGSSFVLCKESTKRRRSLTHKESEVLIMTKRSPFAVFALSLITLGIYCLVWYVKTKDEMNARGAKIPTTWLIIIPIVNFYWLWKYCESVEKVTGGSLSAVASFFLIILLNVIGLAIVQSAFNKVPAEQDVLPAEPLAQEQPSET